MHETWIQQYILLAFRLHKLTQSTYAVPFVEAYYGPPAWRSQIEAEPVLEPSTLVHQALTLADTLPLQNFPASRTAYLSKHLKAMETLSRKLAGESFSLLEEAKSCLDITPSWTPEKQFGQAHALYDSVLPGTGSLADRLQAYKTFLAFPLDQTHTLLPFIEQAFAEARKRTSAFLELPQGETIEIESLPTWEHDAAAYYRGNYHTHIVINLSATATYISRLFDHKVCHEGYPGHHTEYILKEQHLARQKAYLEQTIVLTLCPQSVLTEGIATVAHEIIFSEGEPERWITDHIYRSLHKDIDPTILLRLRQASDLLAAVWDNVALLLDDGRPEPEVIQYITTHMLTTKEKAASMIANLKQPIWGLYNLTYVAGQSLLQPTLQGPDKLPLFRRLLTEQLTPSQLKKEHSPF
jgi:hypothetical protein